MRLSFFLRLGFWMFLPLASGCSLHQSQNATLPSLIPESYAEQVGPTQPIAPGRWWERFGDEHLSELVELAFVANLDLEQAYARLEQAGAALRITAAAQKPTLDISGAGGRRRQSTGGGKQPEGCSEPSSRFGAGLASG